MLALAGVLAVSGCAGPSRTHDPPTARSPADLVEVTQPVQVVLVVLDGVRPREVFEGIDADLALQQGLAPSTSDTAERLMPNVSRLSQAGVILGRTSDNETIWASGPNFLSLPGYREIMTGRPSTDCQDNDCPSVQRPTLADDFRALTDDPRNVAIFSSWEGIERAVTRAPSTMVVSCGRRHGSNLDRITDDPALAAWFRAGEQASPEPGEQDFRPDDITAALGLSYLERVHPHFLFLGLGEPDEYAHKNDYAGYVRSLRAADRVIGRIATYLDEAASRGQRSLLLVTTDHGRGDDFRFHGGDVPESGRVWLLASGLGVLRKETRPVSRMVHLADIAPTIRSITGVGSIDRDRDDEDTTVSLLSPVGDPL